jgi:uncharacterized protein (UPF0332 family)
MIKSFDWLRYINLADKLVLDDSEEYYRTAISRAYYGIFGKMRNDLESKGVSFTNTNSHQELIKWLKSQSKTSSIGFHMDYLRRERNKADYGTHSTITKNHSEDSVALSHRIVDLSMKAKLIS